MVKMARLLILFAHPSLENSRVHRRLVRNLPTLPHLTFHDLYEAYPDFDVDVAHEQQLLKLHDLILLQHPFFWYSTPPLVKQWIDLVLEHGWAYGSKGTALVGKQVLSVISTGGGASAYQRNGLNRYSLRELLAPLEQTFRLCGMDYLPPYVIAGAHRLTELDIEQAAVDYHQLLIALHDDRIDWSAAKRFELLNEAIAQQQIALIEG
jgi:glutathione-regulated potassium-efflux system ancillary protein KefG